MVVCVAILPPPPKKRTHMHMHIQTFNTTLTRKSKSGWSFHQSSFSLLTILVIPFPVSATDNLCTWEEALELQLFAFWTLLKNLTKHVQKDRTHTQLLDYDCWCYMYTPSHHHTHTHKRARARARARTGSIITTCTCIGTRIEPLNALRLAPCGASKASQWVLDITTPNRALK